MLSGEDDAVVADSQHASGTFAEVVSTALFAKLSGGRPGQPAKSVVAIHCR